MCFIASVQLSSFLDLASSAGKLGAEDEEIEFYD